MNIAFLKQLSDVSGIPGREERVRDLLMPEFKRLFDEVSVDPMGSLIGRKKASVGNAPRVLIAAHIDEIGFYVKHIDDKGYLKLHNVGGFDVRHLFSRRVKVLASSGDDLPGLLNASGRPNHIAKEDEKKKVPEVNDLYVDLCLPADEVKKKVRIGDPVTLVQQCTEIGDVVTGKCLDNRVAAWIVIEAMDKITNLKYDLTVAATVQEEVGLRGAAPAAFAAEPHIAIALDTTVCADTPGVPEEERVTQFGAGVAIKVLDGGAISHRPTLDSFVQTAQANGIPYQLALLTAGRTDNGPMQQARGGAKTLTLGVPTRNIHTTIECVHKRDLQSSIDLLAAWLEQ